MRRIIVALVALSLGCRCATDQEVKSGTELKGESRQECLRSKKLKDGKPTTEPCGK